MNRLHYWWKMLPIQREIIRYRGIQFLCRRLLLVLPGILPVVHPVAGQVETEEIWEQLMEERADREEGEEMEETVEETLTQLAYYRAHPLNINKAEEADLLVLPVLSALHIEQFLRYRELCGPLTDLHELQAVPLWDVTTIRLVLPYITVKESDSRVPAGLGQLLKGTEGSLLIRAGEVPEKSGGYRDSGDSAAHYRGSRLKLYSRLRYQYRDFFQYGISGEKDAGEMFFPNSRHSGFDSYSFHAFLKNRGIIKALALGDYTVSLGQGLIHWQGMGTGRGADVLNVKHQAPLLKPYGSAGEYNFCRGAGVVLGRNHWEVMAFWSKRKLDGTLSTSSGETVISSINTSGYHRTEAEYAKKGNTGLVTTGYLIKYKRAQWQVSGYLVQYRYSRVFAKKQVPYNLFTDRGNHFHYRGLDYSYTHRNLHFFGEWAVDRRYHPASLNGVLISLDSRLDLSLVYRNISPSYQSEYGDAFTANSHPGNEKGIYWGINFRPGKYFRLVGYGDCYYFPWLKYRVDAPSYGRTYFLQASYLPSKGTELYLRYRYKVRGINDNGEEAKGEVRPETLRNFRFHFVTPVLTGLTLRNRAEWVGYQKEGGAWESGSLWLTDLLYMPLQSTWSFNGRIAFFETEGYESRIYAYENDVLYAGGFSALYGKGLRYYFNLRKRIGFTGWSYFRKIDFSLRWLQTIYAAGGIGSGLDKISGNRKSEIKFQLIIN